MENKQGSDALTVAKQVLEKTDKEKHPKLYQAREQALKSLQAYEQQKSRAELAEKKAKEKLAKKSVKGESETPKKKEGFDYGELAYLEAKNISEDCHEFLFGETQKTNKELKEILGYEYIKEELKKITDEKASEDAIPEGGKRGGKTTKGDVNYWLAKGELPPANQTELRREYVNAKQKQEVDKSKFTDNPVVGM